MAKSKLETLQGEMDKALLNIHKALHGIWVLKRNDPDSLGISLKEIWEDHMVVVEEMKRRKFQHVSVLPATEEFLKQLNTSVEEKSEEEEEESLEVFIPILKVNEEERMVYGIVLEPNTADAQDDVVAIEEVRKACHRYMENYQKIGYQHENFKKKFKLMECYIAPDTFIINGQSVKKGSWVMATRVIDDAVWKEVKSGKITGYSVGGKGVRITRKA